MKPIKKSSPKTALNEQFKDNKKSLKSNVCRLIFDYKLGIYSIAKWGEKRKNSIGIFTGTVRQCWQEWGAM